MNNEKLKKAKELLERAIHNNEYNNVRAILTKYPECINTYLYWPSDEVRGYTPLIMAIDENNVKIFRMLLDEFNADPNISCSHYGFTPIFSLSSRSYRIELFDILIKKKGVDVNKPSLQGKTPLMIAAQYHQLSVVKKLLAHGADTKLKDEDNLNALNWMGYCWGKPVNSKTEYITNEIVKILIEHGADPYK